MPKVPRISIPGFYHVTVRGNNKQTIFHDESDYKTYLDKLLEIKQQNKFLLHHYALMPNHIHQIVQVLEDGITLSKLMQKINLSYSAYYRKKYDFVGHLWQARFKNFLIQEDVYLLECSAYIELNPVRAGLAKQPEEYPWSSYRFYAFGEENELLTHNPLYFSQTQEPERAQELYREFVLSKIGDEQLKEKFRKCEHFFGSDEFIREMLKISYSRGWLKRKRGRPPKAIGVA